MALQTAFANNEDRVWSRKSGGKLAELSQRMINWLDDQAKVVHTNVFAAVALGAARFGRTMSTKISKPAMRSINQSRIMSKEKQLHTDRVANCGRQRPIR